MAFCPLWLYSLLLVYASLLVGTWQFYWYQDTFEPKFNFFGLGHTHLVAHTSKLQPPARPSSPRRAWYNQGTLVGLGGH
eukprot:SAG22_NODE_9115_length_609_cov_1.374510_1_plen_78_part_10